MKNNICGGYNKTDSVLRKKSKYNIKGKKQEGFLPRGEKASPFVNVTWSLMLIKALRNRCMHASLCFYFSQPFINSEILTHTYIHMNIYIYIYNKFHMPFFFTFILKKVTVKE